ncbi:MAG: hypothetical protein ACRBHB_16570 [Arenicella sp.]
MLKHTKGLLDPLCTEANERYQEGGLTYQYTYAHGRAHLPRHEYDLGLKHSNKNFSTKELQQLSIFFEKVLVQPYPEGVSESTQSIVSDFLEALSKDMPESNNLIAEYYDYDYGIVLTMVIVQRNNFHELELQWSYD